MKKRMIAFVMMMVMCLSFFAPGKGASAAASKKIDYEQFTVAEGEFYSFKNAASGWYMNVKHAGTANGTQLNLYPLDTSKPRTQTFKFTVKDATKKIVQISPEVTSSKYVDVRRAGKPFAAGQGICIWAQDGDPVKNLVMDVQEDGSFYLCFAQYPDYCIGAKDEKSASTAQTQLVVRKKTDAVELRWYLCDADGVDVRDIEREKETWNNPYYRNMETDAEGNEVNKGFGQSYITLFKYYPLLLNNETFQNVTGRYAATCSQILKNNSNNTLLSSFLYSLDKGGEVLGREVLSRLGFGLDYGESIRFESVQLLMQDICANESTLLAVMTQIEEDFSVMEESYSLTNAVSKAKLIDDLAKASKMSKSEVERVVSDAYKNYDKLGTAMELGVDFVSYLTTSFQLYSLNQSMIDYLMESIDENSDLYCDLQLLKDYTGENTYKFIIDKFFNEKAQKVIGDLLAKTVGKGAKSFELATVVVEAGVSILVNHVYQGALADDIAQVTYQHGYVRTLEDTMYQMMKKFTEKDHVVTAEEISRYEFIVSAYLSSLKTSLEGAKAMVKDTASKSAIQIALNDLETTVTYENYIKLCINQLPSVVLKMDDLVDKLENTYFTTTQTASCGYNSSHSKCEYCRLYNIINAKGKNGEPGWFQQMFGKLTTSQFPELTVSASNKSCAGWTCFGFACFAEWYINAEDEDSSVKTKCVATGTYTKEFVQKNVKPGDALRIKKGEAAHSVIVYAVEEDGIEVIDCNRALEGYGSSVVQKSKISYERYAGRTVWVDRATCNIE